MSRATDRFHSLLYWRSFLRPPRKNLQETHPVEPDLLKTSNPLNRISLARFRSYFCITCPCIKLWTALSSPALSRLSSVFVRRRFVMKHQQGLAAAQPKVIASLQGQSESLTASWAQKISRLSPQIPTTSTGLLPPVIWAIESFEPAQPLVARMARLMSQMLRKVEIRYWVALQQVLLARSPGQNCVKKTSLWRNDRMHWRSCNKIRKDW